MRPWGPTFPPDTPKSRDLFEWKPMAPVSRLLGANTLDACLELMLPRSDLGMASPGLPPVGLPHLFFFLLTRDGRHARG